MFKSWCQDLQKYRNQYKAIFIVNLISFVHGTATGWLSPTVLVLQSDETHLESGPITMEELSWIGCLLCVGGMIGNFLFSTLAGRFGRKLALIILGLPNLTFWLLLMFSSSVEHLYVARLFAGITGGGIFIVLPVFVAEIADPAVRGKLNGVMSLVVSVGVLAGYILVELLPVNYISYVMTIAPVIYLICVSRLPETPDFLLTVGKLEAAKDSLWFYKSYAFQNDVIAKQQFQQDVENMQRVITNRQKGITTSKVTWKEFSAYF